MEISLTTIKQKLSIFFSRYHLVIYVLVVGGALTAAVITFYSIVESSSESDSYVPAALSDKFDTETIERINELRNRDQNDGSLTLPPGRTNPFIE